MGKNRAAVILGCGKINDDRGVHSSSGRGENVRMGENVVCLDNTSGSL